VCKRQTGQLTVAVGALGHRLDNARLDLFKKADWVAK
jgi:hypothetical protein